MKLFGNTKRPVPVRPVPDEEGPLPTFPDPEIVTQFDLTDKEFTESLKILLDGEDLKSEEQLKAEPPKEMGKPINTDYHLATDPFRGTTVVMDESDEKSSGMSGRIKGTLLLLSSAVILVLVLFGVYVNLV